MLTVCPTCRHTFETDVHGGERCRSYTEDTNSVPIVVSATICLPSVCPSGINCTVAVSKVKSPLAENGCLSKQQRVRNTLSGGHVICINGLSNEIPDKENAEKRFSTGRVEDSVSPTSIVSFVIPRTPPYASNKLLRKTVSNAFMSSELDLQTLSSSLNYLKLSGWYHKGLSWKDSISLLMPSAVGTFLVRDSSDSKFLYSLSIQTKCGPTSIRIYYCNGEFRLDAEMEVCRYMPRFPCVLKLIQYYIDCTKKQPLNCFHNEMKNQIWMRHMGHVYSQVVLAKPLYVAGQFPSLKHLCRLSINRRSTEMNRLCSLPSSLISYLQQYTFKV